MSDGQSHKGNERNEGSQSKPEASETLRKAADDSIIDNGEKGPENKKIHEETQARHHIELSATDLLIPRPGETLQELTRRSQERESQIQSAEVLGLVDEEKKIVHTGKGMLPLVPDEISQSYHENLKAIQPAKTEAELKERVADATLAWMKQKSMVPGDNASNEVIEQPGDAGTNSSSVEKHDDGSYKLKINVTENDFQSEPEELLANTPNGWMKATKQIADLPVGKQLEVIGSGLRTGFEQYQHEERERTWGSLIGTVQGVGEVAVNLAKVADFAAALIVDDRQRAQEAGAEFGDALGQTIVGGVKLFQLSHRYLYNIGFTGDYAKPFRDIAVLGHALDQKWSELGPREQERLKAKLIVDLLADGAISAGGAAILKKAPRFTSILDTIAEESGELGLIGRVRSRKATSEAIQELSDSVCKTGIAREGTINGRKVDFDDLERLPGFMPSEGESIPLPDNSVERLLHYKASSIEIRDTMRDLPEAFKTEVVSKFLNGRVHVVEKMEDVASVLRKVDSEAPDDYIRQLCGVFVPGKVLEKNGKVVEIIEDTVYVALSVFDPFEGTAGKWVLTKDPGGVLRHELSHALDMAIGKEGELYSSGLHFSKRYQEDYKRLLELDLSELEVLESIGLIDKSDSARELFAQVMGSRLGGCSFPTREQTIKKGFENVWKHIHGEE